MRRLVPGAFLLGLAVLSSCGHSNRVNAPFVPTLVALFNNFDWVQGKYFLLYDPNLGPAYDIDPTSVRVYLDGGDYNYGVNSIRVKAMLDPDGLRHMPLSAGQDTLAVRGNFDLLVAGTDYVLLHDRFVFHDTVYTVLRLRSPIPSFSNAALAVSYRAAEIIGPGHALGTPFTVGGRVLTAPGRDSGAVLLQLVRVPRDRQPRTPDLQHFDEATGLGPVRELELKNIYSLGAFDFDPATVSLTVREGQDDPPVTTRSGVPLLEMLGLDGWDERGATPVRGHDGRLDGTGSTRTELGTLDAARGELTLPDARPFAPRVDASHPFDAALAARANRRLRFGASGVPEPGAAETYELANPLPRDAHWFFDVKVPLPAGTRPRS